jgi:hypothetical protein
MMTGMGVALVPNASLLPRHDVALAVRGEKNASKTARLVAMIPDIFDLGIFADTCTARISRTTCFPKGFLNIATSSWVPNPAVKPRTHLAAQIDHMPPRGSTA